MGGGGGLLGKITGGLLGGAKTPAPRAVVQQPETKAVSASEVIAQEEEDRRKRLLAMNAQGGTGQLTGAAGDTSVASVSRKTLLGQ